MAFIPKRFHHDRFARASFDSPCSRSLLRNRNRVNEAAFTSWETFFASAEKPVSFACHDVEVTCGEDVAFATAVARCVNIDTNGKREPLKFRLTMGLRKIDGRWRVMHEHHSLPAT
jgi:ketosteroid isomerase-like protein